MFVKSISTPSHIIAMVICPVNMPWLFAVGICRSYLPWVCFVYVNKTFFLCEWNFFLCKQTFLNWKQTFFIWEQNFFSFMRISFLTVFLFVIAVAVMGHRIYVNDPLLIKINYNILLMTQTLKGKRWSLWYIKTIIEEIAR